MCDLTVNIILFWTINIDTTVIGNICIRNGPLGRNLDWALFIFNNALTDLSKINSEVP